MRFQLVGDRSMRLDGRNESVGAQLGSPSRYPAGDAHPVHFVDVTVAEPLKSIPDGKHRMPAIDADPHGDPDGGVHAGSRASAMQHCEAKPTLIWDRSVRLGPHHGADHAERVPEAPSPDLHGLFVVLVCDDVGDRPGLVDTVHEGRTDDLVAADPDELCLGPGRHDHLLHRCVAEDRAEIPVEGARRSAALDMAETRHPGVLAEPLLESLLDVLGGDRVAVEILGAFGNDREVAAPPDAPSGREGPAHRFFPIVGVWGTLGDQHPVGACRHGAHQCQVAAIATHHLDHEGALVTRRGAVDRVDGLGDAMQGRVGADGHVRSEHVVVDRTNHPDEGQTAVRIGQRLADLALCHQLLEQLRPLIAEEVGSRQAAVPTDDNEGVDTQFHEIPSGPAASFAGAELGATGGAQNRSPLMQDASDITRGHRPDPVASIDQTLHPFEHPVDIEPLGQPGSHDGAYRGVHPGRVAAARQHRQTRWTLRCPQHLPLLSLGRQERLENTRRRLQPRGSSLDTGTPCSSVMVSS